MATKDEREERRTPRSRACASCRASKHRCDGEEGGISCSRCARNRRECVWPAPQKMGRPRRSAATGDANSPPLVTPDAQYQSRGLDSSSSSNSQSPASSAPWNDYNRTQDGGDFDSASSGTNIANSSSPSQSHNDFHMGDSYNSPDGGSVMSSKSEVLQLIDTFYSIPHTYIPILPSKEEFLANFPRYPPLLVNALLALASQYVSFSTKDYRKTALTLLSASVPPSQNSFDAVNYVRALLLLTYLQYGMAAIPQACQLCQEACSLAVSLGWNYLDADKRDEKGASLGSGEALLRRADMHDDSRYSSNMLHHAIRLTWWECWVTDTMISITCRIGRNLQGVPFKVDIPRAPPLYNDAGCPIIWYFPLRIRALTLLIEAAGFPECPDAFYRTKHAEQFATFDTIIENVLLECGLAWADCVKVFAAQDPSHTEGLTSAAAQGQEIFFMAILMLHAASIHLHHLYAMPEVNFDVRACGITTGSSMVEVLRSGQSDYYGSGVFLSCLRKIVSASRSLMTLVRCAHQSHFLNRTTLQPVPFFSSDPVSASLPLVQTPPRPIIAEDILRRSPFCGCSQVVAAFGAALEVATASNKWQAIAAESNFETSKMVLQRVGKIWPVATIFEQELDNCHGAIQGALEIW